MRTCVLIAVAGALLAGGCGGDDEPSRAAEPAGTATNPAARTEPPKPATQAEQPHDKPGVGAPSTSTTPKQSSKKKPKKGDSRAAKPPTPAPRAAPGDAAEALEAEDKAREGVPILGGGPPDR